MASSSSRTICFTCNKEKITYPCQGCSQKFCFDHLAQHRTYLSQQLEQLQNDHDQYRQILNDQKLTPSKHSLVEQIDQWERDSIDKIKQTAQQCREKWISYSTQHLCEMEKKLNDLAQKVKEIHQDNEFNEIDLNELKKSLDKLHEELNRPTNVLIEQQPTSFINNIVLWLPFSKDIRWKQSAIAIAGGNGQGNRLDQLSQPLGIYFDDLNQITYIADYHNNRIVEWKLNAVRGQIVAGGKGQGKQLDQLYHPTNVFVDRHDNSLIITDRGNKRVLRWSRQKTEHGQIIIENIECGGLAMHQDGSLYVSDADKNEVRRWKKGETQGTVVAGGNGQGNQLNQFYNPTHLFVNDDHTLYISDTNNHRVMKWTKDAKEGIIVAGGNAQGDRLDQLSSPVGVAVDQFGQVLTVDYGNHRVMCWYEGAREGRIVAGGNGKGPQANQLSYPQGLSIDGEGNFYIADCMNHRIGKIEVESNKN